MEKVEEALTKARSIQNLWKGMMSVVGVPAGGKEDKEWQNLFVKGLGKPGKMRALKEKLEKTVHSEFAQKTALFILEKLIEFAAKAYSK
jgi:hypothetical protein